MDNLFTLTVNETHYYLVNVQGGKLLIDAGWNLAAFKDQMQVHQLDFNEIRYVMFTHHHHDHAGIIQDIKDLSGAKLIIHDKQIPYLDELRWYYRKNNLHYNPIKVETGDLVSPSRATLASIGIRAEIIEPPGFSPDSISLALDNGFAFIGDLPMPNCTIPENRIEVMASWRKLISKGMHIFFHSRANPVQVPTYEEEF